MKKKNYRSVRNLQRLVLKNFSSRLIVSQKLIQNRSLKDFNVYKAYQNDLFLNIFNLNNYIQFEKIIDSKFYSIEYQFLCMLWVLALLPVHETFQETLSYNYRLYRDHTDVLIDIMITARKPEFKWILIIKPAGFFSKKNKKWLLQNIVIEKKFLICFLNSKEFANFSIKDYNYNQDLLETTKISLTKIVKNFSLQGYESFSQIIPNILEKKISFNKLISTKESELYSGPIIYYNGLILIPHKNLTDLNTGYKSIFKFIDSRGLVIKKNRIWVINLNEGFNFLGWFLKKEKKKITIKISYQNIRSHKLEIKKFLKSSRFLPIDKVITRLNMKIIQWQAYYAYTQNLPRTWSEMNHYLFWRIWRWCKKRHKNKGSKWLYQKYWSCHQNQKWVFHDNQQYLKSYDFKKKKIVHLSASINACKKEDLKKIQQVLFHKYAHFITGSSK